MLGRAALERHPPKASVAPGRSRSTAAPPPQHHCPQWLGMAMNGVGLRRTEEPPPAIAVKSRPGLAIGDRALLFVDRVHLWCRSVRVGLALPPAEHRVVLLRSPPVSTHRKSGIKSLARRFQNVAGVSRASSEVARADHPSGILALCGGGGVVAGAGADRSAGRLMDSGPQAVHGESARDQAECPNR